MSSTPSTPPQPVFPGRFLGGYLLFFIGMGAGLVGSLELARGTARDVQAVLTSSPGAVAILAVSLFLVGLGTFLMAGARPVDKSQFSFLVVCMFLTPLPFLVGVGINYIGHAVRQSWAGVLQPVLLGAGVFLLALGGLWISEGIPFCQSPGDLRQFAWMVCVNFGIVALMLAFLPWMAGAPATEEAVSTPG